MISSDLKDIKNLNLSRKKDIDFDYLNNILSLNNIEYLDISDCFIDITPLIKGLKDNHSLKYLDISYNRCSNLAELGLCLKNIKSLQCLYAAKIYDYTCYEKINYELPYPPENYNSFKKPNDKSIYMLCPFVPVLSAKNFLINLLDGNNTLLQLNISSMISNNNDLMTLNNLLINNKTLMYLEMSNNWWIQMEYLNNNSLIDLDIIINNINKYSLKYLDIRSGCVDFNIRDKYDNLMNILESKNLFNEDLFNNAGIFEKRKYYHFLI